MKDVMAEDKQFRIDPKIRDLIPPLTDEEFTNLEREILDDGKINEPLVTYDGVLLDGHHRYKIAKKHNIPYEVAKKDFDSWEEAVWWVVRHQKARRNLTKTQEALLVADAEELVSSIKAEANKKQSDAGKEQGGDRKSAEYRESNRLFPKMGKADSSPQQQLNPPNPQADVPIQIVHMPEPTIREQARQNQAKPPELKAQPLKQETPQVKQQPDVAPMQDAPKPATKPKPKQIHTNKILAEKAGVSHGMMDMTMAVKQSGNKELLEKMRSGEISANKAYQTIKREKKAEEVKRAQSLVANEQAKENEGSAILYIGDSIGVVKQCDLLLTDPPYSTDVDDIDSFVKSWLFSALDGVKHDGFAYVFCGAYPTELKAYLNAEIPNHMKLEQILVWEYKNTLGNNPKDRYKQNWQACLFYRGENAPALNCPITNEQWAVQSVNAPDGRLGDRYHAWQKPLDLVERFIRHTTKKGDVVYDPFSCTGTTLVAAAKLGRNGIGYEIDPKNAEIAFGRGVSRG